MIKQGGPEVNPVRQIATRRSACVPENGIGEAPAVRFDQVEPVPAHLTMTPTRMHRFQVRRAKPEQAQWLARVVTREGEPFGTAAGVREDGRLELEVA